MSLRAAAFFSLILLAGCAARQPRTWRLMRQPSGRVLIPPGVKTPDLPRTSLIAQVAPGGEECRTEAVSIRPRGRGVRVDIARDALLRQPPAWLSRWTAEAESRRCIAPGVGLELAARILEAVPLDPAAAYQLLHASDTQTGYVDLGPENRIQVASPILRDGTAGGALLDSAKITGLTVEVKASSNLLGFETAWYAIRPKTRGIGFVIAPVSAERHIEDTVTPATAPATNYLQFPPDAAYYRLFYKAEAGTMRIMIVSGPTRTELDRRTQALAADPNACVRLTREACVLIPEGVAVNPDVIVTVDGRETAVPVRTTVGRAIVSAGEKNPESVLARLSVRKPYRGRLVPVVFDSASSEILNLVLSGGEDIVWR